MRLEFGFLRSVIARRVFWVLLAAATVPLLVFAALGYGTLADRLEAAARSRLQEAAKYAGLRVYDRLVSSQTALAAMAAAAQDDRPPTDVPLAVRELFRAVATIDHHGGAVQGAAELAPLWRRLTADRRDGDDGHQRRLWWAPGQTGQDARVLLGVRDERRWWVAELSPDFLWGDLRERDAVLAACVTDARGVLLLCPGGPAAPAQEDGAAWRTVSWSLFMRSDFGTVDWVFIRHARRDQLTFVDLPLEQVVWKAAVFSLLLVGGLGLVLVRRTTVPLERLMAGTRRLARRDWAARVQVPGRDEFAQLAESFNDLAGRIQRQMEALQVQAGIDREILSGLDLPRVLGQVQARLHVLAPAAASAVLLAPGAPLAQVSPTRWWRLASHVAGAAEQTLAPGLLRALDAGPALLDGTAAAAACVALGQRPGPRVLALPARQGGQLRALLLLAEPLPEAALQPDGDLRHELQDLCDRLAVLLVAASRERELRERAVRDSLTGLFNRAGLVEQLDRRLLPNPGHDTPPAFVLAFIDLDGFKEVNDARGHPVGDALLCDVARLLREAAPDGTAVARLGGDEFVLLLPAGVAGAGDQAQADVLAGQLTRRLGEPFVVAGQTLRIGASIGLVHCPQDGRERVELMRRADLAMYAAKAAGRGRHAWFDPAMDERAAERAWVRAELPRALQQAELLLHYQPRVQATSGRLASVEALVRWQHPQRGLLGPGLFVPVAEEGGLIELLGRWVLDAACRQQRAWRDAGVAVPRVAVNVSALQLANPGFADEVLGLLRRYQLTPGDLEIEITESLFAGDVDEVISRLQPLRSAGLTVALDDFGTGFSSLSSLYRLPVDVLKIDRSFVVDLGQRASADAVARSVVALARALGKHVVAEGVETDDQYRRLLDLGCDELQGYRFARPLPPPQLLQWLERPPQLALPAPVDTPATMAATILP